MHPKQEKHMMLVEAKGILFRNYRISTFFWPFKILDLFLDRRSLQKNLLVRFRLLSWFEVESFWFTTYFYSKLVLMKPCYCLCVVLREKIICLMFPAGKELSLFLALSFSLSSHQQLQNWFISLEPLQHWVCSIKKSYTRTVCFYG